MGSAVRVVAIGDNVVDVYANLNRAYPGGGSVNFAAHAARLGAAAGYVGVVGDDWQGSLIRESLLAEGVDVRHLRVASGPTAVAYVRLEKGERTFVASDSGVRYQLRVDQAVSEYLSGASLIHTTLDGRMEDQVPVWRAAGQRVSFDFSDRASPNQLALLPLLYIAFFAGQKTGPLHAKDAIREFHARGGRLVVMTLGAHGSLAYDGRMLYQQAAESIQPVDTLGAGDGFIAGFMISYLRKDNVQAALASGTRVASRVCAHYGAFNRGIDLPKDGSGAMHFPTRSPARL